MTNRLLRVFLDVNMGKGHVALTEYAKQHKVSVAKLEPGEHVVFINRKADKMKIFSTNNVVSYKRETHRLDLGALQHFAECFGADGFKYDEALKKVLMTRLVERRT